jgi:hypothetical protein
VVREHAYITRVKANAFICIVPRYGIEGIVYVADKRGNTPFVFDDDEQVRILSSQYRHRRRHPFIADSSLFFAAFRSCARSP